MTDYLYARCGQMDLEFRGYSVHCPFNGTNKVFRCRSCNQYFCVHDDEKTRNEAFLGGGKDEDS